MFILRKMISVELNYNIYNKKLFIIVVVFQMWRVYMKKVSKITIFIDYKNLINFYTTKKLNRRQVR